MIETVESKTIESKNANGSRLLHLMKMLTLLASESFGSKDV